MREGKPYLLVVGGSDTGRGPLLAALLRHELGPGIVIGSAGAVGHAGEPADSNVHLALEQAGITLAHHIARQLDQETMQGADLLLGVDRGSARVARVRTSQPVEAISELANGEDIPDPHRMPLGIWITALREYQAQIGAALPKIREILIKPDAAAPPISTPTATTTAQEVVREEQPAVGDRAEHLQRIVRLLDTARVLPEIVDWSKLVQEVVERLNLVAELAHDPDDLTPGATLMLAGALLQTPRAPGEGGIDVLLRAVEQLHGSIDAGGLVTLARLVAE